MKNEWKIIGEDTGGYVEWCENTGAIKDSDDKITYPGNIIEDTTKIKIVKPISGYTAKQKFPQNNKLNFDNFYFLMENDSLLEIKIYEPHGYFNFLSFHIIYNHEEIIIFDNYGTLLSHNYTR